MNVPYIASYGHYLDYTCERYTAVVWGQYSTVKARCEHEHGCKDEAIACAEALISTLPEQHPLEAKPQLILRIDGEIGSENDDLSDYAPSYTTLQRDWEDEKARDDAL